MKQITHIVDTRVIEGKPMNVVRNFFVYDSVNYMAEAHKYFTKKEKKLAKSLSAN